MRDLILLDSKIIDKMSVVNDKNTGISTHDRELKSIPQPTPEIKGTGG